jgi:plasmid maintenance system antidote protein VapI
MKLIREQVLTNDLSFSSIVDIIQGDEAIASEMIYEIAKRKATAKRVILEMEKQLSQLKAEENILQNAIRIISKHIQRPLPLYVNSIDGLVIASETDCIIDENII